MSFKERYWKYSLIVIIIGLGLVLLWKLTPFMGGILGAATIYIMVRNQMCYLTRRKGWKRNIVALALLIESILIFLIPLSLFVWMIVHKVQNMDVNPTSLIQAVEHFSDLIYQQTGYNMLSTSNLDFSSMFSFAQKIGQIVMSNISSFAINMLVLVFVLYFMLVGGTDMEKYIADLLPFAPKNKQYVLEEVNIMVKSNTVGIPLLAIIQGFVAFLGYVFFQTPSPFLFGVITCFATILPIIGTAIIWLPLVIYMIIAGDVWNGVALGIYAIVIISNVDNLARFMLQKKLANIHPLITIFGVFVGLSLFGFVGVIFGPLLLSMFFLCLNILKKEYLNNPDSN
jgi:predicted PurR-regulated permease PerM